MNLTFSKKDILEHGIAEIIGDDTLATRIDDPTKPLKVKLGIDPTSPNLHLGRTLPIWRLRAFQELGHEIHIIIGDFTGQIGDASDKEAERPMLAESAIKVNMARYEEQLWMILNPAKRDQVHFHRNSEWLLPLNLAQISAMADVFSVNNFIKRELVAQRLEKGSRISLREMLYPLMQAYDSVMLEADVELGGTDQRFNLLAGRDLQESKKQKAQAVIMNQLISGTDGRKMSSSWGNVISLLDSPEDKFGKMMRVRDDLLEEYLLVLPLSAQPFSADELKKQLTEGVNPRDLKMKLANVLVELYHGGDIAKEVEEKYIAQFRDGQIPEDIPEYHMEKKEVSLVDLLVDTKLATSKAEARRLISQGGVRVNELKMSDVTQTLNSEDIEIINVGKRAYLKIVT